MGAGATELLGLHWRRLTRIVRPAYSPLLAALPLTVPASSPRTAMLLSPACGSRCRAVALPQAALRQQREQRPLDERTLGLRDPDSERISAKRFARFLVELEHEERAGNAPITNTSIARDLTVGNQAVRVLSARLVLVIYRQRALDLEPGARAVWILSEHQVLGVERSVALKCDDRCVEPCGHPGIPSHAAGVLHSPDAVAQATRVGADSNGNSVGAGTVAIAWLYSVVAGTPVPV